MKIDVYMLELEVVLCCNNFLCLAVCSDADVKTLQVQLGLASPEQKDGNKSSLISGKESNSKFQMVRWCTDEIDYKMACTKPW